MAGDKTEPAQGAKKKSLVVVLLVALLVFGGGGAGGAYLYLHRGSRSPAPAEPGIVALDPFVVNLADPGGRRFLRATLRLVVESKDQAAAVEKDELARTRVRSAVLEFLTLQTADGLVTPEGKTTLKQSIAERASQALGHTKVIDVLLTEFVVQF